jgi:RNA-directed DNA polymerase
MVGDAEIRTFLYCKDGTRRGWHEHERFTFLGFTFRPRLAKSKHGNFFVSFLPAVSDDARKTIGRESAAGGSTGAVTRPSPTLPDSSNPIVQGWINYYGRFYKSRLYPLL